MTTTVVLTLSNGGVNVIDSLAGGGQKKAPGQLTVLSKGRKYLTLKRLTRQKGYRDITMTYSLDAEEQLMRCLNDVSGGGIDALIGQSLEVPKPIKMSLSKPVQ